MKRAGTPEALAGDYNQFYVTEGDAALLHTQQRVVGV